MENYPQKKNENGNKKRKKEWIQATYALVGKGKVRVIAIYKMLELKKSIFTITVKPRGGLKSDFFFSLFFFCLPFLLNKKVTMFTTNN